jgi:hypothetical protein
MFIVEGFTSEGGESGIKQIKNMHFKRKIFILAVSKRSQQTGDYTLLKSRSKADISVCRSALIGFTYFRFSGASSCMWRPLVSQPEALKSFPPHLSSF